MSHTNPTASADAIVLPVRQAQELLESCRLVCDRLARVGRAMESRIGDPNAPAAPCEVIDALKKLKELQALLPKVEVPVNTSFGTSMAKANHPGRSGA